MDSQAGGEGRGGGMAEFGPKGRRVRLAHRVVAAVLAGLAIVAAVPLVTGLAVGGGAHGQRGHRPRGFKASDYPVIPKALMEHPLTSAPHSSPAARRRSRTAYRGHSRRRALRLLRATFPQLAQLPKAATPRLPAGSHIERYLGDYAMRVRLPHSRRRQIVLSPLPLRKRGHHGRSRRPNLRLHAADAGFEPINPLVDTSFPTTLGDGISIGDQGVRVRPASSTANSATGSATGGQVFYPDTATDQDMLVSAVPTGVELFTQIRAVDAPETQALAFDLPAGAELRATGDGGAEVVRGSERLALVLPPSATDADGQNVPAQFSVSGNRLTVTVSHREGSYAYPILVDPVIEDWGAQSNWQNSWFYNPNLDQLGWFFADSPAGQFISATQGTSVKSYGTAPGRGLYAFVPPDTFLPAGSYGEWLWRAPGSTTFIPRADFGLMYRDTQADTKNQSVLVDGIYSESQRAFEGVHQFPGRTLGQSDTVRPGDNVSNANPGAGNLALFALAFPKDHKLRTWTSAYLGGAAIYLDDPEAPTITGVQHSTPPPAWVDPATAQATVAASDPGLGVQTIKLTSQTPDGANPSRTVAPGCGTRVFECPNQASATFRYADLHLPDGTSTLSVRATDPIAHTSAPTSWQVRADSSAPTLSVAGRLHDAAGHFLDSNDYPLQVSAADGDATHPNSGVKSIEIQVDGQRKDSVEQSCDASCPLSRSFTLHPGDYSEGNHTVTVIATDAVGHQAQQSWQVKVDRTPPVLTLSGELTNHAGEWLGGDSYGLTGAASDAGGGMKSIEVLVDGERADYVEQPCDAGGCSLSHDFTYLTDRYGDGQHAVTVIATDQAGNQTQQAVTAKVDRTVPTFSLSGTLKDAEGQQLTADSYGLSVNAFDGDAAAHQGSGVKSIELQVDGQRADYVSQPCDAGSCPLFHDFTLDPAEYRFGSHTIRVIVTDQAGRTAESSWQVSVPDNPADAPPRAPHLSGTATTSLYDASRFLYAGPNAVQTGADPAAITPVRAAVLRGKVTSSDGQPLGGVHLTVVDHPEYGSTLTRANGELYMVVNGGGR